MYIYYILILGIKEHSGLSSLAYMHLFLPTGIHAPSLPPSFSLQLLINLLYGGLL